MCGARVIALVWLSLIAASTTATTFGSMRGAGSGSSFDDVLAPVEPQVPDMLAATTVPVPELPVSDSPKPTRPTMYEYVEIPQATPNSNTFRKVPRRVCPDAVSTKLMQIYKKNHLIFDACAAESHYQIFPYSGIHVTDLQLRALVKSKPCRAIATVCVVAQTPECDISDLPLKAVTETLLKLMLDVENGAMAVQEIGRGLFFALYQWRRDVNLARSAKVPFGNDSALYKDFTRSLHKALADSKGHVSSDLTITLDDTADSEADRPASGTLDSSEALLSSRSSGKQFDAPTATPSSPPKAASPSPLAASSAKNCRHQAGSTLAWVVAAAWLAMS